jgi:GNAT superfamily N-acetyltransferase
MTDQLSLFIRPAMDSDAPTIHHIVQLAFAEYASLLGLPTPPQALLETQADIIGDIHGKRVLLGFVNMQKAIGSVRYDIVGDIAYISRFAILPSWQQSGMGRALLTRVEEECRQKQVSAIALHTGTKLMAQARFYYANGFYVHSTTQDHGYIRGLFVKELHPDQKIDLSPVLLR